MQYLEGLENVHTQVNIEKDIDEDYAEALGSDLAFLVLSAKFRETKRWYVDKNALESSHPLYRHIESNTWPTDFGYKTSVTIGTDLAPFAML